MQHLAIVMDGNRRWAKKHGLRPWYGHKEGAKAVERVMQFCLKNNVQYLSLFTFSLENFKRSPEELGYLFDLVVREAEQQIPTFKQNGVQVRFVGDRDQFPEETRQSIEQLETQTVDQKRLIVNFLFCYGGRQEIVSGAKTLFQKIKKGLLSEEDITEKAFSDCLWTHGMPEPDLIIRTGGAQRLSGFLLYQAAYAELYFLDCLWPEITNEMLMSAAHYFYECRRNFGT